MYKIYTKIYTKLVPTASSQTWATPQNPSRRSQASSTLQQYPKTYAFNNIRIDDDPREIEDLNNTFDRSYLTITSRFGDLEHSSKIIIFYYASLIWKLN